MNEEKNTTKKKILFYVGFDSHIPHMMPLYERTKRMNEYRTSMMRSGEYNYPLNHLVNFLAARAGLREDVFYGPNVTFIADPTHRPKTDPGILININHGVGSKGATYVENPKFMSKINSLNYIFSPSDHFSEKLRNFVSGPQVITTGMPKLDRMFNREFDRNGIMKRLGLSGSKIILFAPTYNPELSAIEVLGDSVLKLAGNDTALIIKLHCKAKPIHRRMYDVKLANTAFIPMDEPDITPYMSVSDLMISDYSSAWLEFLAQDKPIVLVNNPGAHIDKKFDDQPEYEMRDAGIQANNFAEVREAVESSLKDPKERSGIRQKYRDLLFDHRGTSTDRCLEVLKKICAQ
jgi:hypothetical protein